MVGSLVSSKYGLAHKCVDRSMTRDEEVFPDAESFEPERFIKEGVLNKEVRDPRDILFGFGRRCIFLFSLYYLSTLIPFFFL
jgi:hypothetical protein